MTNLQVIELSIVLNKLKGHKGAKFNHFVSTNKQLIHPFIEALKETELSIIELTKDYESERIDFNTKYCIKGEDGQPVFEKRVVNNQPVSRYTFTDENKILFDKELNSLQEKYKEVLGTQEKEFNEYELLLKKESEFIGKKIEIDFIPDTLLTEDYDVIHKLIE